MDKHVAFVGAGAMGSYVGGRMAGAGIDVTLIDPWGEHIDTIKRQGLVLSGTQGSATVRVNALHVHEVQGLVRRPVDVAFIAVKSYDTEWATLLIKQYLSTVGYAVSTDRGVTWQNLGIILEAPPHSEACASSNRYVIGGVGDVSVMVDREWKDVYLYYSNYGRDPDAQGVLVARFPWADRDAPRGRVTVWQDGVWLSPTVRPLTGTDEVPIEWDYPSGTPIVRTTSPWHDGQTAANAFWGPSLHWNTSLQQYVMLLNRTRDESFTNEGIYISFAPTLDDPRAWSTPKKILSGGGWYPQVAGLEPGSGTDREMGGRGRFLVTGRSTRFIEFR